MDYKVTHLSLVESKADGEILGVSIGIPCAKLGVNKTLRLEPGLRELAEAYLHRQLKAKDLKERVFQN